MNTDGKLLKALASAVDLINSRIERFGDHIGGHETRTRVILIDPLLRSIGWYTEDPEMVVHEYGIGSLKVDYALFSQGELFGILEAKALGRKLNDEAWGKFVAEQPQVAVVAFTDGEEWRFFRKSNNWQRETVNVSDHPGGSVLAGFEIYEKIGRRENPHPPPPGGKTLPELRAKIKAREFPEGKRPTRVIFSGLPIELPKGTWKELYVAVANRLVTTGRLQVNMIDVRESGRSVRSLVTDDKESFKSAVDISGGLWLQGNVSRIGAVDNSNFLLEVCDVDPATVRVHFDEA